RGRGRGRRSRGPKPKINSPQQFHLYGYYNYKPVVQRRSLSFSPKKRRGIRRLEDRIGVLRPLLGEPQQQDDTEEAQHQRAAGTSAAGHPTGHDTGEDSGDDGDRQEEGRLEDTLPPKRRRLHGPAPRCFKVETESGNEVERRKEPRKSVFDRIGPKVESGREERLRLKSACVKIEQRDEYDFAAEYNATSSIVPYAESGSGSEAEAEPEPKKCKTDFVPKTEPEDKPEAELTTRPTAEPEAPKAKDRSRPAAAAVVKPEPAADSAEDAGIAGSGSGDQPKDADELVLGIDLGTTNSVVAVVQDGDVEVLVNDVFRRSTPSCVHVSEVRQVGEAALRMAITDPDKTVRNVKRALGRTHADLVADGSRPLGPVKVALDPVNKVNALLAIEEELLPPEEGPMSLTRTEVRGERSSESDIAEKTTFPSQVAAVLLMELKKAAETQLGRAVRKAVIAVPNYFNTAQRQAVLDAGYLSGLKVMQLVNEPTAAAMAYAHGRDFDKEIVVVDVGGGGCSISVVRVRNDNISVLASSSDRLPGGEDFDGLMLEHIKQMIKSTHSKDVADDRSHEILRSNFESSKQKLSRIPLSSISTFLPGVDAECNIDINREMFESVCGLSFKVIADAVKSVVKASGVPKVDEVILIGGSTRIPMLRSVIQEELGAKIGKAVNPDETVAKGAALLGAGSVCLVQEIVTGEVTFFVSGPEKERFHSRMKPFTIPMVLNFDFLNLHATKISQNGILVCQWTPVGQQVKLRINVNGVFEFVLPGGHKCHAILVGCLSRRARKKCLEKLSNQAAKDQKEQDRVHEKNLLENALREQLNNEVWESSDSGEHREKVAQKLKWLEENPHASLEEILRHKNEVHQAHVIWKQEMARREEEESKNKLVFVLNNIMNRKVSDDDIAKDLEIELKNRCSNVFERIKNGDLSGTKDYVAIFETISKEGSDLNAERLKRQLMLQTLNDKLRAVMLVEKSDPAFKEATIVQEKWVEKWKWVQRNPVDTAENFQQCITEVSEDLLRLANLREAARKLSGAVNVNQLTCKGLDVKHEPTPERPGNSLALTWDRTIRAARPVNHIQAMPPPPPAPHGSASESALLWCLSRAVAMQTVREARDAVLIINQTATEQCGLASLALRFADATCEPVERLVLVRPVDVLANPGEEGRALAHDFLDLCERSGIVWREMVYGVNTDSVSSKTAEGFLARLRLSTAGGMNIVSVPSDALPLDEKVVMRLHEAAARDRFDGEISIAVSDAFCTLDSLRTLFFAGGRWFPLLRSACTGMEEGDDPWATYDSSLRFLHANRQGVASALRQVAWRDLSFQKQALHLLELVQSDWRKSFFWCVVMLFVKLFEVTRMFSPEVPFVERCRRALVPCDMSDLKLHLIDSLRRALSAGEVWREVDERYLTLLVALCVDTTLAVLEPFRSSLQSNHPLVTNLLPLLVGGGAVEPLPPSPPPPPVAHQQLAAELHRLREGFAGARHPAFPTAEALLLHLSQAAAPHHFPALGRSLRRLLALPIERPRKGWRAADQLGTLARSLSATYPKDRLHHAIVVASRPRGANDKAILNRAAHFLQRYTAKRP
ncbi:Heat shock 70 kDa protein 6, partial [Frankliniella fusca]